MNTGFIHLLKDYMLLVEACCVAMIVCGCLARAGEGPGMIKRPDHAANIYSDKTTSVRELNMRINSPKDCELICAGRKARNYSHLREASASGVCNRQYFYKAPSRSF